MATQKRALKNKVSDREIDEQISMLADILVEGFIWQHEHKDEIIEPHIPKLRKKSKEIWGLDPGQNFYL